MSTLKSYLTTIADAIRQKKGTTEPINASNFASEILSIQGGGSLNVAYSLTPPTDTSKIWLQCAEPQGVEVQNYLGECAVSNVANWGGIDNPVAEHSIFISRYYSTCYIGNNQIAIVGYNHIRIYDYITKSYIADYTISVGTSSYYSNVIYKDNVLYFGYGEGYGAGYLYSYNLITQTLTNLSTICGNDFYPRYIFFNNESEIDILYSYYNGTGYRKRYNLDTKETETIASSISTSSYGHFGAMNREKNGDITIKVNKYIYTFIYSSTHRLKYNLSSNKIEEFTSFKNFCTDLGISDFAYSSVVYDGERYIYIIGGGPINSKYDNIIKYDTLNDTFEILEQKLLSGKYQHFSVLVDNRVYMFGGSTDSTNNTYGRPNQIDYFDLSYPLPQNNAIITTNTVNTDNSLPLINTEKLKLNSNIASAYLGNANNLAEKVNAYYHNGNGWVGINCDDYREE